MAEAVTFRVVLTTCGITQALARNAIVDQGYSNMEEFSQLSAADIQAFVKEINKMPAQLVAGAAVRPTVPFASIKKLRAMRHWTIEQGRLGIAVVHTNFTAGRLTEAMGRMDFEAHLVINKPSPPPLPDPFTSFAGKWRSFYEGFKGHLAILRGCMNIPLIYVVRESEEVTAEIRAADYDSTDSRLIATVALAGEEYAQDNKRVWDLLRPLVYGTTAWAYVKHYGRATNGRLAFRVLETRGEGNAALDARRTKAEQTIATARYTGKSKRFTIGQYTNVLQNAFTEMEECGEPYTERRKVDIYVKGMEASRMESTKTSIIQNADTRGDFQQAYTFVETMEQYSSTLNAGATGFDRTISAVEQANGSVDTAYRNSSDWNALSKEERARIISSRGGKPGKKKNGGGGGGGGGNGGGNNKALKKFKRKVSKLFTDATKQLAGDAESGGARDSYEDDSAPKKKKGRTEESANPSAQFGRNAHAVVTDLLAAVGKLSDK